MQRQAICHGPHSVVTKNSWARTRGAQLTAGYTVNTYSKPPLYYTLGAVAPLLSCRAYARRPCYARHTHSGLAALCADRQTDTRQTRLTNQPTGQPTGQQPFCQYPAVSWEFMPHVVQHHQRTSSPQFYNLQQVVELL